MTLFIETFPALAEIPGFRHGFVGRVPNLDVHSDREIALGRLDQFHGAARAQAGLGDRVFITGQQIHGANVATVDAQSATPVPEVDGLITADPRVCLGVYVADCGPRY